MVTDAKTERIYPTLTQPAEGANNANNNDLNKAENTKTNEDGAEKTQPPIDSPEVKDYRYFWKRVLKDLKNKNLIPVKILFFFKYATLFVLYPFLTLHMDSLGLDEWEIGVNQACVPIVAILGPPISGVIADKIGNFKIVLAVITLINAVTALFLLFVPTARETIVLPRNITFEITCDSSTQHFILNSIESHLCTLNSSVWNELPGNNVVQCGKFCHIPNVNVTNTTTTGDATTLEPEIPDFPMDYQSSAHFLYQNKSYTFSTVGAHPLFACGTDNGGTSEQCKLINQYNVTGTVPTRMDHSDNQYSKITFAKLMLMNGTGKQSNNDSRTVQPKFSIEGPIIFDSELHDNPRCVQPQPFSSDLIKNDGCETKCFLQMERKAICTNDRERKVYNVSLTFGLYTLFRLLLGFASATSFIMFEGAVLAILKRYGGDYGLQRVSATFAAIITAPISGMLLQNYSFRPIFFLYAGLQTFSAILTLEIDLTFKKPADNVIRHLKEVLSQIEILIFFVAMLVSGTAWGYLESFLFLYLKHLGGSQTLMGLTISVGGVFGLPFLIFSRPIIKRLGHINILCIGLFFYGVRYFGYSFIENPWMCLPFEAMESITASLAITAAATYAVALSTLQTIATVQGIMGALYFGIGRGVGSFIGGLLIKKFGHRFTLKVFSVGSFVACLLYTAVHILYLRRHSKAKSGIDINNMNGTVISNGSAKLKGEDHRDQFQMKPTNHDSELGYGKVNPGFEDVEDGAKFTDIPLDEDSHSNTTQN